MSVSAPSPIFMKLPERKRWGGATDIYPNPLITTLALTAPAALPIGQQLFASAPPPKHAVYSEPLPPNQLVLGFPIIAALQPFHQLDWPDLPPRKRQVFVDQYPNLLISFPVAPGTRPFTPADTTQVQLRSKSLTADVSLVAYIPSGVVTSSVKTPVITRLPERNRQVFAEPPYNRLPLGLPAQPATPISQPLDISTKQLKYQVIDHSADWPNTILLLGQQGPPPPPFKPYDFSRVQRKFQILDYLIPNSQLPNPIPSAGPTPPPIIISTGPTRTGGRVILEPKKQGEKLPESFNFISRLGSSELIVLASCTCSVYSGTDPSPSTVLFGVPTVSGTIATQEVQNGIVGVTYELLMTIGTSLGNVLEMSGYLTIIPDIQ